MYKNNISYKKHGWISVVLCTLLLAVGFLCYFAAKWYADTYGTIGFDAILYTLTADLAGTETDLILSFAKKVLVRVVFCTGVIGVVLFFSGRKILVLQFRRMGKLRLYPFRRWVAVVLSIVISGTVTALAAVESEFTDFIYYIGNPSTLYEDEYRSAKDVTITFPEEKRNLIYIYIESMETAFLSEELGGALEVNTIPELSQLAMENINFSHNDQIGGFFSPSGTTWTVGALVGQTSGIPLKIGVGTDHNEYGLDGNFLPGAPSLTDILHEGGYTQALMFGSDANFGGRYQYYTGHGMDLVFDYFTAMEDGIIPQGYKVWWGMEDAYLYEYARQELTKLAAEEAPFAFTMLTADTHHVGGYVCGLCEDTCSEQYENVYRCASRQVYEFVQWLQQQDFYERTTIVIVGDHPSMDADYFTRNVDPDYDRRVYNCFIHSAVTTDNQKNRSFSTFDMFPTTLAAMGCTIEGDRLGLGTNLFSDVPTLMETMGEERFDDEVARYATYYFDNFY